MLLKKLLFLMVLVSLPAVAGADDCNAGDGTVTREADVNHVRAVRQSPGWLTTTIPSDYRVVRMRFHVVRSEEGLGGISLSDLQKALDNLNDYYRDAHIVFAPIGGANFIDSDAYFYDIDTNAEFDALRGEDRFNNAINVYIVNILKKAGNPICGRASFPTNTVQGIVMTWSCTKSDCNPSTFPHEVGHYLNLLHTHEGWDGSNPECVARPPSSHANCTTAGDLFCDTNADPNLEDGVNSNCNYTGPDYESGCNGLLYNPPTTNLMSYSSKSCRTEIENEQLKMVIATVEGPDRKRVHIGRAPCDTIVYADSNANSGNGTWHKPFESIQSGMSEVCDGGYLVLLPGTYSLEGNSIQGSVRITPSHGTVRITI